MQRRIVIAVIAASLVVIAGVAGLLVLRQVRGERPDRAWVPLPLNPQLDDAQRQKAAGDLKTRLTSSGVFLRISRDLDLASEWELGNPEAGAQEIEKRLFVEVGEMPVGIGMGPSVNVGVTGKRRESGLLREISVRLMKEVWDILGIKPPPAAPPGI